MDLTNLMLAKEVNHKREPTLQFPLQNVQNSDRVTDSESNEKNNSPGRSWILCGMG